MLVSEFLALVPGPNALVGAVIESRVPDANRPLRIAGHESIGRIVTELSNWHIVERPPLYQDPSARYCGWCEARLYTGYNPGVGLVEGWCPNHGIGAKVLHEPDAKDKRYIDSLLKLKDADAGLSKAMDALVDVRPGLAALQIPRKYIEAAGKPSLSRTAVEITEQQSALIRKLGLSGIDEFKKLSGIKS